MTALAIGIAGYGKIARDQHVRAIAANPAFELKAIADPSARHESLPSYRDVATMLASHPGIAAVSLCMPPRFRAAAAREVIAAKRHVLLEKPPCATLAEAEDIVARAREAGVTSFAAWHSREAAGVSRAREWLAQASVRSVEIAWKEDVRVWHPGQEWIWREGGFGVFDPAINALSILTAILPGELRVIESELEVPANCATPIAARLTLEGNTGLRVTAEFDFLQTGPQVWDIAVETERGRLVLSDGGNRLRIDGQELQLPPEREYQALYERFGHLIRKGESDVDLAPLRLAEHALSAGRIVEAEAFVEAP